MVDRFYSTIETGRKKIQGGSNDGIIIELNTSLISKNNTDYIIKLLPKGDKNYNLSVIDKKLDTVLLDIIGEHEIKRECVHDLDRYGKCVNCGRWIVEN